MMYLWAKSGVKLDKKTRCRQLLNLGYIDVKILEVS